MKKRPVIIWGHPLHSHTHSYIHHSFYKVFKHMGHETYWLWEPGDVPQVKDALIITEGQVHENIPIRPDWHYLLHNCDTTKYEDSGIKYKILQVYTSDVESREVEKIAPCEYYQPKIHTLYQPWATDLLPDQMDAISLITDTAGQLKHCNWVGSIMDGKHGNIEQVSAFATVAAASGIEFRVHRNTSPEMAIELIKESFLAPAILGGWQANSGYIPCRIFKNISYGHLGVTNSDHVNKLFDGKLVHDNDPGKLFNMSVQELSRNDIALRREIFEDVKTKHTYLNRAKNILEVMEDYQ